MPDARLERTRRNYAECGRSLTGRHVRVRRRDGRLVCAYCDEREFMNELLRLQRTVVRQMREDNKLRMT